MHKFFQYFLLFLLLIMPSVTFATQVRIPDSYFFTSSGGPFVVYDNLTGNFIGGGVDYYEGYELTADFFGYISSEYKIVEMSSENVCQNSFLNYDECIASPYFIQIVDTINLYLPLSDGGGGGGGGDPILDPELTPSSISYNSYPPVVEIFSILKGSFFSDKLIVDYKVTDRNDQGSSYEKYMAGVSGNPVSISYSDRVSEGFNSFLYSTDKKEIIKDQPLEGKYEWSVKDLIPGTLYRIVVDVVDMAGMVGQGLSEFFGVDFIDPVFTVEVNPPAVRSGEVTISIDSSEDLGQIPEVKVIQNGGESQIITMKGEKSHYEGVYKVVSGFDGQAIVKVSGVDIAGNKSEEIVSGGSFSVGVNPPPKPKIKDLSEKFTTNEEFIDITGSTRVDTEVILSVNSLEISRMTPDKDGNFTFKKIQLSKTKNNGLNYISINAKDPLGTLSESALLQVKYNIAPTVNIIKPVEKEVISNIYSIDVEGKDENNDNIFYTYQVLSLANFKNKIFDWVTISEDTPSKSFPWNTAEVADGSYVIQVIADDKEVQTTSLPILVIVKNVLPSFLFEDGRSTITNKSSLIIKGKVMTSTNLSPRPNIVSLAYSMDNGLSWTPVVIINDGGAYQKKFAVEFKDLKEGTYPIWWRTKDSRDFIGKIMHPIVIDMTAPKPPVINTPRVVKDKQVIIQDNNDENIKKSGVQISIKGFTESSSTITLSYNNQTFTNKSLPTGAFYFNDITFDKRGLYNLSLFVTDQAGNKSPSGSLSFLYNNLPVISFINPKPFRGLSGNANVSWSIKDIDGDVVNNVSVSYRNKDKDSVFKNLISNTTAVGNYLWNTNSLLESNNYELKISAQDQHGTNFMVTSFSIDRTKPVLNSLIFEKNQLDEKNKQTSFVCKGETTDNLSGIEFVEYSIETQDGKLSPWYKGLITSGYLKNKATYQIKHPVSVKDGSYKVRVRTVDVSGNISESKSLSLFVDETAPRVGGFFLHKSNINLNPDENGNFLIYKNSPFVFTVSLEGDTETASLNIGEKIFKLQKSENGELWKTSISIDNESTEKIFITAKDTSSNIISEKEIGSITTSARGVVSMGDKLIVEASINVLKLNEDTNQYNDFIILDNNSPVIQTNKSGEYDLVLPSGNYKLIITSGGTKTLKYNLNLTRPSIVNNSFVVSEASMFSKLLNKFLYIFK